MTIASRKWHVCVDPAIEDVEVEAQTMGYDRDTGWLQFYSESKPVAAFPPGKWVYVKVAE